ncbi:MAG TPA: cytochrome b/b6 domain-containing protein [Candidatus Eisenbacteria bacterium]|nr:cytochrome b/b6 domain-containing protein [Candidatus Eisenbacteria bacterium]
MSNDECLACHSDPSLTTEENGKQVSLQVDGDKFKTSIHSSFSCVDCHTDVKSAPHESNPEKPKCATCHADEQTAYDHGVHAKAGDSGNANVAKCQDCHGNVHEILPSNDPKSKVAHANIPQTCGACHAKQLVMASSGVSSTTYGSYEQSVHGKAVKGGSEYAAVCTDCHGAHDILTGTDPKSPIAKFNVPATCGKCHAQVEKEFMQSIHGEALLRGNWRAPVCTDCHGIHTIEAPTNPKSSVAAANVENTCASCHASVKLTSEFGVPGNRVSSYLSSYHGMASRVGSAMVANCASCHGVHNILPSSDPRSTINPANLAKTCGQCHPGANAKFITAKVHLDGATQKADVGTKVIAFISKFYIWMIVAVIGGMVLHNILVFRKKLMLHRLSQPRILFRMTLAQRAQHLTLLISFFSLVLTGFALRYPSSWLADVFINEHVRSLIHRVAGVVLIAVSMFHIRYIIKNPDGRQLITDMLPDWKDVTDVRDAMRYYLGFSEQRPMFRRFSYAEKAEYWALVWGMFVMAGTGLMIWFKVLIGDKVPGWWIDVAITIHWYEAVLATLAIIVWHIYAVIFDPDAYPMNWAWFDGRMSIEQYEHEHPLDTLAIIKANGSEQTLEQESVEEHAAESSK